jgi:hypothetical protein
VQPLVLIAIVVVSTLAALVATVRSGVVPRDGWRPALWTTLGLIGVSAVFFVVNLAIGIAAILLVRLFTPLFVSIYVLNDITLVGLSLLQGLVFGVWCRGSMHD